MNKALSIITITYNDPVGLEKTLLSLTPLAKDTSVHWEHVIVDSSSDINSSTLVRLADWPLKHVITPPRGVYHAFNEGIKNSTGQLIWFLNGGDRFISVEPLKKILELFTTDASLDIVGAPVEIFRNEKYTYSSKIKIPLEANLLGENNLCHQGVIYKRSIFDSVGLFDESFKLAGDYDHFFKCHLKNVKFKSTPWAVAQFDRAGISDNFRPVFKEYRRIWKSIRKRLKPKYRFENDILSKVNFAKLTLMKSKYIEPVAGPLRAIWYKLH